MYVKYNGGNECLCGSSDPSILEKGKIYKVEETMINNRYYCLVGVHGVYNRSWFDELPIYLGVAKEIPREGKKLKVIRQEVEECKVRFACKQTSTVCGVEKLSSNTYLAITNNSVYIVQVQVV